MSAAALEVIGILLCLGASAFFSSSETSLTSLDRTRTRRLIDGGTPLARHLEVWLARPSEVISTILVYNNVVNTTASALGADLANRLIADRPGLAGVSPLAVAVGAITLLLLTFGEITPKTLARQHAERFAPFAIFALRPLVTITRPINLAFVALSRALSKDDAAASRPFVSEEELGYLFELGSEEGTIPGDQAEILESVLELDNKRVRDVMVPVEEVVAVPASMGFDELLAFAVECGHSRIPVFVRSIEHVVGLVYAKDLLSLVAKGVDRAHFHVRDIMRPVQFAPADQPIDALLRRMKDKRSHLAVVTEQHRVIGVVALEDIVETLIGEVFDEYDDEEAAEYLEEMRQQLRAASQSEDVELGPDGRVVPSVRPGQSLEDEDDAPPNKSNDSAV